MNDFKMWNVVSLLYWIKVVLIWCMLSFFACDQ